MAGFQFHFKSFEKQWISSWSKGFFKFVYSTKHMWLDILLCLIWKSLNAQIAHRFLRRSFRACCVLLYDVYHQIIKKKPFDENVPLYHYTWTTDFIVSDNKLKTK